MLAGGNIIFGEKKVVEIVEEVVGLLMMTLDQFTLVIMSVWRNQSLIPFLNRWKYHLYVENNNFGWKTGGENVGGSLGNYH